MVFDEPKSSCGTCPQRRALIDKVYAPAPLLPKLSDFEAEVVTALVR